MNTIDSISENDDILLAEYVLGVLETDERETVEAMLASNPAYVSHLTTWQTHLAPFMDEISPETPPEYVWARIREGLGLQQTTQQPDSEPAAGGWWGNLSLWRWLTAGGLAAAIALAALLVVQPQDEMAPGVPLTAALQLETGQTFYTAAVDADRSSLVLVPAAELDLEGRVAQLWLIAGDTPPQSLGLLPTDAAARLPIPDELRSLTDADSVFAISLEPPGGSPTGLPTGPVVAQGVLASI